MKEIEKAADLLMDVIAASNRLDKAVSDAAWYAEALGLDANAMRASQALQNKHAANEALILRAQLREQLRKLEKELA